MASLVLAVVGLLAVTHVWKTCEAPWTPDKARRSHVMVRNKRTSSTMTPHTSTDRRAPSATHPSAP